MSDDITLYITKTEPDCEYDRAGNPIEPIVQVWGRTEGNYAEHIKVRGFYPYFYVEPGHGVTASQHSELHAIEHGVGESLFGDTLDKVYYKTPWPSTARELKTLFPEGTVYESDVSYTNRFLIDMGIKTGMQVPSRDVFYDEVTAVDFTADLRIVTFDIETDDRGDFPEPGEAHILGLVAHDNYTDETVAFYDLDGDSFEDRFGCDVPEKLSDLDLDIGDVDGFLFERDEASMLKRFAEYIQEVDPDVLTAWNIDFDASQLVGRMDAIGVDSGRLARNGRSFLLKSGEARILGRECFDLLYAYKKSQLNELPSYSLNSVAQAELGHEKVDHSGMGYYEMYRDDPELFVRYNVMDVQLAVGIDGKAGVFDFKQALRHEVGISLGETRDNHTMIEMFARRELFERGLVAPDARHEDVDEYDGAHVFEPFKGLTKNVTGMDLASLYPNTMAMFNMSPETKVEVPEAMQDADPSAVGSMLGMNLARAPNGTWFNLDKPGIFAGLVDKAIGLKEGYGEAKDKASGAERDALSVKYAAAKAVTNSLYGVLGWRHFFLYDRDVALAITSAGVACIKETARYISEETDGRVIYGDTDSNYVAWPKEWLKDQVLDAAMAAADYLNDELYPEFGKTFGVPPEMNRWEIQVESYAVTYFQHGKKKKYAMRITWDEGKDVDKEKITGYQRSDVSPLTQELINDVLWNIVRHGGDQAKIGTMVQEAAAKITSDPADADIIGIPGGLGKEINPDCTTPSCDDCYRWNHENNHPTDAHPRAAWFSNHLIGTEFGKGSKPKRVYLQPKFNEGVGTEVDVLAFEEAHELPDDVRVDVQRMTGAAIISPMEDILDAADIDVHAAIRGQTQTGLGAFL
ncbi:DNA-directed DNA polymerase [Halorubellus litoreus]|uniref:DNA-directed DNA polymerase n=1 Tax=Halorubellus litoreus TaxID=755308 RepID=A0ABD5VLH1_9EURY